MGRWRRIGVGLLAGYAASTTLLACRWYAEIWSTSRLMDRLGQPKGRVDFSHHPEIFRDFGIKAEPWESGIMTFAGLKAPTLAGMIGVIFVGGLIVASLPRPRREPLDKD